MGKNKLNIACMVHNAYHYYAEKFALEQGHDLDTFGSATFYFYHDANLDEKSYDLLVLFSGDFYSKSEEDNLAKAVDAIREKSGKEVTSAYLYCIPEKERVDNNPDGVILKKVTADGTIVKKYLVDSNYDVIDLIYEAIEFYNNDLKTGTSVMKTLTNPEEKM